MLASIPLGVNGTGVADSNSLGRSFLAISATGSSSLVPARAQVTGITINQFQVDRGNALCKQEGVSHLAKLVQGDFMNLPFKDNSFDGVYAIEATCHAPDRAKCYGEILRVLKPGATFACYEWCLTDAYDGSERHKKLKKDIEVGDGLPDLVHTSVCTKALADAGFDIVEARDCALDGLLDGGDPWHTPLTPSWNPLSWPRFQFNPVMFFLMPRILTFLLHSRCRYVDRLPGCRECGWRVPDLHRQGLGRRRHRGNLDCRMQHEDCLRRGGEGARDASGRDHYHHVRRGERLHGRQDHVQPGQRRVLDAPAVELPGCALARFLLLR